MKLGLLVLRASDAARTRRFYEALGLSFSVEQHETGALHYSCELGDTVLEIYPGHGAHAPEANSGGATMIGLSVGDLDAAFTTATAQGARVRRAPSENQRRAVLEDPDGRVVELTVE
jgi:catechol 2,3-dioxygenase-like lactoylglutathione lyase family enzyme